MPMVSVDAMRAAFLRDAGAAANDIVYLSRPADWRFQVTTPNASSHYVFMQLDTRGGPLVMEVPPAEGAGLFGSLNDAWQVPVLDVGPAGEDQGRGGRYLITPPGYHRSVPLATSPRRSAPTTATRCCGPSRIRRRPSTSRRRSTS
jgi:hypothetical protein